MVRKRRKPPPPALPELEAQVMEEVWRDGEATVRTVLERLNRGSRTRAYNTIMTILVRLNAKGLVTRTRRGRTDVYAPAMTRAEYLERRAQAEVGAIIDQYGDLALAHFARHVDKLDAERLAQLRKLANGESP
jgi:predicted transcriptional regulator